jgi:hypothetical protein
LKKLLLLPERITDTRQTGEGFRELPLLPCFPGGMFRP